MKRTADILIALILIGMVWGLSEIVIGKLLYSSAIPYASALLGVLSFLLLAVGRGLSNKLGSSLIIGLVALILKAVDVSPFYCHLLGILVTAISFEVAAVVFHRYRSELRSRILLIATAAYINNALFALLNTYLLEQSYWSTNASSRIANYVFVDGTLLAILALVISLPGFALSVRMRQMWLIKNPSLSN